MTVQELIEVLSKMPQDKQVEVGCDEDTLYYNCCDHLVSSNIEVYYFDDNVKIWGHC